MADVKWIKITPDIFNDEKILLIEAMPSADSIIVIWFKLLAFAGQQNNDGVFLLASRIAYTDEMLATIFRREVTTVRMALSVFESFGMIEIVDNVITIPNWNKYQTLDAYEKKKERDRLYSAERRAKQAALIEKSSDNRLTVGDSSSSVAVSDIDKEEDKDKELSLRVIEPAPKPKKPEKHKYGSYNNVLLSDEEMEKLKAEFPNDWNDRIERVSSYVAQTGKGYSNYLATIRNWARRDAEKQANKPLPKGMISNAPATDGASVDRMKAMLAAMKGGGGP